MILFHLKLAHHYWQSFLKLGDFAIDATCGKGYDSLVLAKLLEGHLLCIDIQKRAIETTKKYLKQNLPSSHFENVIYYLGCHSAFPPLLQSPRLIVYNLGYLPGSDKKVVTATATTLNSLQVSLNMLQPGGALSITCYRGHEEGKREEAAVLSFAKSLIKKDFQVCCHQWINCLASPSLLLIQKSRN